MSATTPKLCPTLTSVTHAYSFRRVPDDNLALQQLTKYNSLDLLINSFLSTIPLIWSFIPFPLKEREALLRDGLLSVTYFRDTLLTLDIMLYVVHKHHIVWALYLYLTL